MSISVSEFNGIKSYNFSFGKSLPDFLEQAGKKSASLKKDQDFRKRIELIQDFSFNGSSQWLEASEDGQYIIASGVYKPSLKIFDVNQLSIKHSRGIDSEIIKFRMLSQDYKKVAMICKDRNVEFHAQYGRHHKLRTPKVGRDLLYNPFNCDLLIAASSDEIYRLNLEEGRFMKPLQYQDVGVNCLALNQFLDLTFAGGDDGKLGLFDNKTSKRSKFYKFKKLVSEFEVSADEQITALYSKSQLQVMTGTSEGVVKLFDLRYSGAVRTQRHPYMLPIHTITEHKASGKIITSDEKSVRYSQQISLNY